MTVFETFKFAFDSMCGGTHQVDNGGKGTSLTDDQKDLIKWMDEKQLKVLLAAALDFALSTR